MSHPSNPLHQFSHFPQLHQVHHYCIPFATSTLFGMTFPNHSTPLVSSAIIFSFVSENEYIQLDLLLHLYFLPFLSFFFSSWPVCCPHLLFEMSAIPSSLFSLHLFLLINGDTTIFILWIMWQLQRRSQIINLILPLLHNFFYNSFWMNKLILPKKIHVISIHLSSSTSIIF